MEANPNKIHTVDKAVVIKNVLSEKPIEEITEVLITQNKSDGLVKELYRVKSLPPLKHGFGNNRYELSINAPHITKDPKNPYVKKEICIYNMNFFIEQVAKHFEKGHLYVDGYNNLNAEGAFHYKLTYKQVKFMLAFERKSSRFMHEQHEAIKQANPLLIDVSWKTPCHDLDCGEYTIHSLNDGAMGEHHQYSCSTFNSKIVKWIQHVIKTH